MSNTTEQSRQIVERLIVTGTLELLTPTSLGNGDADGLLDMPLSRDAAKGVPLLPGSSIAGALRNYLRLREHGYREQEQADGWAESLFGGSRGNEEGSQSPLIIDDALARPTPTEIRDGVRIDPRTRTAQDKKKFDLELLPAGTSFPLRFELVISEEDNREKLVQTLALALSGFEQQEIFLGARKRRGFGRCKVAHWHVQRYHLLTPAGLLAWIAAELPDSGEELGIDFPQREPASAAQALGVTPLTEDKRKHFTLEACFELASPLLIRSSEPISVAGNQVDYPDTTHLHSMRLGKLHTPVLPGTSLAGALRTRAHRILMTLTNEQQEQHILRLLDTIFGSDMVTHPESTCASRLVVEECSITADDDAWLVQQRVSLDRFTGGAYDTSLFSEAPLTDGKVQLRLMLQGKPPDEGDYQADVGLLLLLLKDLWTSDLPLGGTSSIGRGRLRGISARLCDGFDGEQAISLDLNRNERGHLQVSNEDKEALEVYVAALQRALHPAQKG